MYPSVKLIERKQNVLSDYRSILWNGIYAVKEVNQNALRMENFKIQKRAREWHKGVMRPAWTLWSGLGNTLPARDAHWKRCVVSREMALLLQGCSEAVKSRDSGDMGAGAPCPVLSQSSTWGARALSLRGVMLIDFRPTKGRETYRPVSMANVDAGKFKEICGQQIQWTCKSTSW